jgi:hypothetical protein
MEDEVKALMEEEDEVIWRQARLFSSTDLTGYNGYFKTLREAIKAQLSATFVDVAQTHGGSALCENLQGLVTGTLGIIGVKGFENTREVVGGKARDKGGVSGVAARDSTT